MAPANIAWDAEPTEPEPPQLWQAQLKWPSDERWSNIAARSPERGRQSDPPHPDANQAWYAEGDDITRGTKEQIEGWVSRMRKRAREEDKNYEVRAIPWKGEP